MSGRTLSMALFESIDVEKVDVPFSLASARSSFLKTIGKVPPSAKSQEFKDGVVWADCLSLLAAEPVVLVTSDKAFFRTTTTPGARR